MYVYIKSEPNLWTVGFYRLNGNFEPESDHSSPDEAAERVALLNGSQHIAAVTFLEVGKGEVLLIQAKSPLTQSRGEILRKEIDRLLPNTKFIITDDDLTFSVIKEKK